MAERSRRQIKIPERFADPNVFWGLEAPRPRRLVYRVLKTKDIAPRLQGKEVHLFWPDDNKWYRGLVDEVNLEKCTIYIHYPEDDQYEEIDAKELMAAGHVAVVEERAFGAPLHVGDIPLDEVDRATATYLAPGDEPAPEPEPEQGGQESDEEAERQRKAAAVKAAAARAAAREHHKQVSRKRIADSDDEDSAEKRARLGSAGSSEVAEAEKFRTAVLGALMGQLGSSGGGSHVKPTARLSVAAAAAAAEQDMRKRAREQLVSALQTAADELRREGLTDANIAIPGDVGVAVELALYKANGGLTKEYKTKFRSLVFNLKDPANPDLRARVLQGELPPDALVALSPAELASKTLSAWRSKKAEEMAKAKFLDEEAAAKFSTAAAAAMKDQHVQAIARQVGARLLTQDAEKKPDAGPKDTQAAADGAEGAEAGAAADNSVEGASGDGRPHGGSAARLASGGSGALAGADGGSLSLASPREHADTGASRIQALLQGMGPTDPTSSGVAGAGSTAVGGGSRVTLRPTLLPRASLTSADGEHTALGADGGDAYDPEAYNTAPLADPSTHGTAHDMPDYQPEYQPEQEDEAMVPEPEVLKDLAPIVVRAPEGSRAASLVPGDLVWRGMLHAPEFGSGQVVACHMAGAHEAGALLGGAQAIEVKGMVRAEKVEDFMNELAARSRSRQVCLAMLRSVADGSEAADGSSALTRMSSLYGHKGRTGVFHPGPQLEAYVLPPGRLAARLLLTARLAAPPALVHLFPADVPEGEMLVAIIHRREWAPPVMLGVPQALAPAPSYPPPVEAPSQPPPPQPQQDMAQQPVYDPRMQAQQQQQQAVADPRQAAAMAAAAESQQQQQQAALPSWMAALPPEMQAQLTGQQVVSPHQPQAPSQQPQQQQPSLPESNALSSLLSSLAPALGGSSGSAPPPQSGPGPSPAPHGAPPQSQSGQQGLDPSYSQQQQPQQQPAAPPGALDPSMLASLAASLQQAGVPVPGGASEPPPQGGPQSHHMGAPSAAPHAPPPGAVVVQNPDGSFRLLDAGPQAGAQGGPAPMLLVQGDQVLSSGTLVIDPTTGQPMLPPQQQPQPSPQPPAGVWPPPADPRAPPQGSWGPGPGPYGPPSGQPAPPPGAPAPYGGNPPPGGPGGPPPPWERGPPPPYGGPRLPPGEYGGQPPPPPGPRGEYPYPDEFGGPPPPEDYWQGPPGGPPPPYGRDPYGPPHGYRDRDGGRGGWRGGPPRGGGPMGGRGGVRPMFNAYAGPGREGDDGGRGGGWRGGYRGGRR